MYRQCQASQSRSPKSMSPEFAYTHLLRVAGRKLFLLWLWLAILLPLHASFQHGRMSRMYEAPLEHSIFVAVDRTFFRFSSLLLSSNRSFWLAPSKSCVERVLLHSFRYSSLH